ncbi:MAG: hypothetical protein ACXVAY_20210 [Mucilaginibacter sp.]
MMQIAISTFIPFVLLAKFENTYIPYRLNYIAAQNEFTLYDIKILFSHTMPLFYVTAFTLQLLLIIPAWNWILANKSNAFMVFTDILSLILCFSFGASFIIWDSINGVASLASSVWVLVSIQVIYWALNFATLYLLEKFYYRQRVLVNSAS